MSKVTFRRVWFVPEEKDLSGEKFCVDDSCDIPSVGDFVESDGLNGTVKAKHWNYYQGSTGGMHEVVYITLGKNE